MPNTTTRLTDHELVLLVNALQKAYGPILAKANNMVAKESGNQPIYDAGDFRLGFSSIVFKWASMLKEKKATTEEGYE